MPEFTLGSDRIVDKAQLESCLSDVQGRCTEPEFGIHGPGSVGWELGREAINFLGAGRASALQLAHPAVAFAIEQHSKTRSDPRARFAETFRHVFRMSFGTLNQAIASARRVHAIHATIVGDIGEAAGSWPQGRPYHANDPASLRWVWATLLDTMLLVQDATLGPLPVAKKCQYYRESCDFARLFGLRAEDVPVDYFQFKHYVNQMILSPELTATRPAREMLRFILSAPNQRLAKFASGYRRVTAGLLSDRLREEFGFQWTPRDARRWRRSMRVIGAGYRRLPRALRFVPAYSAARLRVGSSPYPLAEWIARFG